MDEATGRKLELAYDSGNQLVQVVVTENKKQTAQQYRYDAFGRRLAKYNMPANSESGDLSETDYFGWDGDRLIHTERFNRANAKDDNGAAQPEVIHTIYEPGSFTPLVQLRRTSKAAPDLAEELLAQIQPAIAQDALRSMFTDLSATTARINENIGKLGISGEVQQFMRQQLHEFEQAVKTQREEAAQKVEIRHYLCDHLGTPNALIREDSRLDWAVQLDAWGNVRAEHNPGDLYQPIRLPGQHADGDTGLYYNRHRYYEQQTGRYINQDPIGLKGGLNVLIYGECNPLTLVDPYGLQAIIMPPPPIPFPIGGMNSGGFPRDPDDIRPPSEGVIVPPPGINWPPSNEDLGCRIEVPPTPAPKAPKPDCETQADMCWKIAPTFMSKMWCMMGYLACKKIFKGNDGH